MLNENFINISVQIAFRNREILPTLSYTQNPRFIRLAMNAVSSRSYFQSSFGKMCDREHRFSRGKLSGELIML